MDHIHGQGICHRDLKPANVLMATVDSGGGERVRYRCAIADFGLSKLVEDTAGMSAG